MTTPNPADAGSGAVVAASFPESPVVPISPWGNTRPIFGDRIFRRLSEGSAVLIIVLIVAIGGFLLLRAIPALRRNRENFFSYGGNWITTDTSAMHFGIFDLLQVTVFVSLFALILAMPIALGVAIFLTQYAPRRLAGALAYTVDLLAAVPSIIYGVWGLLVLAPQLRPVASWLNHTMGWCVFFATGNSSVAGGGTIFTGGIVLAVMILPIIAAVTREVFVQTPHEQIEAALALGRHPLGSRQDNCIAVRAIRIRQRHDAGSGPRPGGDGRAADHLARHPISFRLVLFDGGSTFATKIAGTASEFNDQYKAGAYIAAGLVLFLLTFVIDALARQAVAGIGSRRGGR